MGLLVIYVAEPLLSQVRVCVAPSWYGGIEGRQLLRGHLCQLTTTCQQPACR